MKYRHIYVYTSIPTFVCHVDGITVLTSSFSTAEKIGGFYRFYVDHVKTPVATLAFLPEGDDFYVGLSLCNPNEQFNKKRGRQISSNRAFFVKGLPSPKSPFDDFSTNPEDLFNWNSSACHVSDIGPAIRFIRNKMEEIR